MDGSLRLESSSLFPAIGFYVLIDFLDRVDVLVFEFGFSACLTLTTDGEEGKFGFDCKLGFERQAKCELVIPGMYAAVGL